MNRRGRKQPTHTLEPSQPAKQPTGGARGDSVMRSTFKWCTSEVDLGGPFSWGSCEHAQIFSDVIPRLQALETMTWSDVHSTGSHPISIEGLCKDARDRLSAIGKNDEYQELYSVRLSGRERIWGMRVGSALYLLWWDPEHEICPSRLKHT